MGLYKGLGAVLAGIIPKMAIRFTSFDWYKQLLANPDGTVSGKATFLGRLFLTKPRSSGIWTRGRREKQHSHAPNSPYVKLRIPMLTLLQQLVSQPV